MTLEYVAAIIESNYYNGKVMADDQKMNFDDFLQMARAANGDIMRNIWYQENQRADANAFFYGSVTTERFPIVKQGRFYIATLEDGGAVKLPNGMGILRVAPAMSGDITKDEECDEFDDNEVYARGKTGFEYSFGQPDMLDDLGEAFYVPIGNSLRLFGFKQAKFIDLDYIKNDESLDLPESIAWQIILAVIGPVAKESLNLVDTLDDGNPNVTTVKKKIADPQGLDSQ